MFSFSSATSSSRAVRSAPVSGSTYRMRLAATATVADRHALRDEVGAALARGAQEVIIDVSDTHFVDSSVMGVLLKLCMQAERQGAELRLVNPNPDIRALLKLVKLEGLLEPTAA